MRRTALALVLLAACHRGPATSPSTGSAAGAASSDPALAAALASPTRTDAERARDVYRHPAATLAFFGIKPDLHVVEIEPGGGWYTAILAPYLHDHGALTVTSADPNGDPSSEMTKLAQTLAKRLASSPAFDKVTVARFDPSAADPGALGPDGSADLVLTFRNVHNWLPAGTAPAVFAAAAKVLKPGGVLGVCDHRSPSDRTPDQVKATGYLSEAQVIALAKAAGFALDARSDINANPKDTADHPDGVWSLPPTLSGGSADRDKLTAIGESDRMTLRFKKQ